MIGNLINIKPDQVSSISGINSRKPSFWRRPWFRVVLLTLVFTGLACYVGVMLWLRQFRLRANDFNLMDMKKLEVSTILHDRTGKEIAELAVEARRPVRFEDIPYHFIQCLQAAEDGRFFEHHGVDYLGIARAMIMNFKAGRQTQGASTITQQLARQTFSKADPSMLARTKERKITEVFLAKRIEENYTKSEILEMYLNRIYFGSGCWGVNAAAMRYFGKSVKELTLSESATICGLVKSPDKYSPLKDLVAAQRNRDQVLGRMVDEHFLTASEAAAYKSEPVKVNPTQANKGGGYLVDKIHAEVGPILEELGYDEIGGQGLHIYTTIDSDVQKVAEESVKKRLQEIESRKEYVEWLKEVNQRDERKGKPRVDYQSYLVTFDAFLKSLRNRPDASTAIGPDPSYLQAAVVLLDNKNGEILAMVGGRDFTHNKINLAESKPGHAPGTAFLPFVYGAAFEGKSFPGTRLNGEPFDNSRIMVGSIEGILGEWGREGQADLPTKITARGALIQSMNGASARLGLDVGLPKVREFATKAGLDGLKDVPSTILGTSEVTLSDLALAYTTFPNGGKRPGGTSILSKITDAGGRLLWEKSVPKPAVPVTDDITAFMITSCLQDCLDIGTASVAHEYKLMDGDFAAKTGTHVDFKDLTFAGYSSEVTCAVWTGLRDKPEMLYPSAYSNRCALPIWVDVMNAISAKRKPRSFDIPEKIQQVELCAASGLRATDRCFNIVEDPNTNRRIYAKTTYKEFMRPGFKLDLVCDVHLGEGVIPEEAMSRPEIVLEKISSNANARESGGNPIPVVLKEPIVVGSDPYGSEQIVTKVPRAARPAGDAAHPSGGILEAPDIGKKTKIDIPEPPPVKIE
jgi:membrane carboxypeptidase/penicillin-binding protein